MANGRNTSVLSVRLPDELATSLRTEARRRKQLLNDYLKSILTTRGLPEPKPKEKLPETAEVPGELPAGGSSTREKVFKASPSPVKRDKARAKRKKAKHKRGRH